tara:strand:- start:5114 stop:5833 length:720 start_codon:yes stop_codon:yes gene_type:complete
MKFSLFKLFTSISLCCFSCFPALANSISIKNYGHSSLLIKGDNKSILLNPFKSVGCAKNLKEPNINVDLIFANSELADEGAKVAKGLFFVNPGSYLVRGFNFEGFAIPHDRLDGRRYGQSTLWTWTQGGFRFAHLGSTASKISTENKILIGNPDVLIIGVGGGPKTYTGAEAALVVKNLKPKFVIPVQYSKGNISSQCDLSDIGEFISSMPNVKVRNVGNTFNIKKIEDEMVILIMKSP